MSGIAKMFGGDNKATKTVLTISVVILVVVGLVALWCGMNGFSMSDRSVTDYDCDIRFGCVTRPLTQNSVTNILLSRAQNEEAARARAHAMSDKENFDLSDYEPGVDRPYISQLQIDNKLRGEDISEAMTGRSHSDYVFQQFGNDGTVINPATNPLFRPARHICGVPPPGLGGSYPYVQ